MAPLSRPEVGRLRASARERSPRTTLGGFARRPPRSPSRSPTCLERHLLRAYDVKKREMWALQRHKDQRQLDLRHHEQKRALVETVWALQHQQQKENDELAQQYEDEPNPKPTQQQPNPKPTQHTTPHTTPTSSSSSSHAAHHTEAPTVPRGGETPDEMLGRLLVEHQADQYLVAKTKLR